MNATDRGLESAWQPAKGRRYFREGDTVRLEGERGGRYKVLGFRSGPEGTVADVYGGKGGRKLTRTVLAPRLVRISEVVR